MNSEICYKDSSYFETPIFGCNYQRGITIDPTLIVWIRPFV